MSKLVECVPNFSEGRNKKIIDAIADAISTAPGCRLIDVDPGPSTNRTVYTFVGSPSAVLQGALKAARVAFELIDMSKHKGEHPRLGALDVCPFIPLRDVTMDDCVKCAEEFGRMLASALDVPVYLYGEAARCAERRLLPDIRAGEYEGLAEKLEQPEWKPDFGPTHFFPTWGATAVGARKFLIAYNVNLLATKEQAHRIALNIRENGRSADQPGRLKKLQGMGWYLEEQNLAQVSTNILDHEQTPLHVVFEECCKDADELNLPIVGSQVVGLVPLSAMLQTADYYLKKESLLVLEEDQKIRLVVDRLGLNTLGLFSPKERIIEYVCACDAPGPLASMELADFVLTVGSRSPSPGGGSVAALCGALGTALASMVGFMSYGSRKFEHLDSAMRRLLPPIYNASRALVPLIDDDAAAFAQFVDAAKLPKATNYDRIRRDAAMAAAMHKCIEVPMQVATIVNELWPIVLELAKVGNIACKSDLQIAQRIEQAVHVADGFCAQVLELLESRNT